jgi:hypothetical protein
MKGEISDSHLKLHSKNGFIDFFKFEILFQLNAMN